MYRYTQIRINISIVGGATDSRSFTDISPDCDSGLILLARSEIIGEIIEPRHAQV